MTASPSNSFLSKRSKRAKELQQSDSNPFRPQSPPTHNESLSTVQELQDNSLAASQTTQGRPRAGTLPSTFHLSDSRTDLLRHLGPSASISNPTQSLPGTGATTPVSDFPFASRPASLSSNPLTPPSSRLRSGSLTIPPSGLANAFNAFGGTNVFGTGAWTPRPVGSGSSNLSRLSASTRPADEDDSHVRTLGYLGLEGDDGGFSFGAESQTNGLRDDPNQLPSTESIDQRATQPRLRSQTVAAYPKSSDTFTRARGSTYSTSSSPNRNRNSLEEDFYAESSSTGGYVQHSSSSSTDSTRLLYSTAVPAVIEESTSPFPTSNMSAFRPRAATIGNVEEQRDNFMRRRAGTMAATGHRSRSSVGNQFDSPQMVAPGNDEIEEQVVLSRNNQLLSQSPVQWKSGGRANTPEGAQAPTRSLWIGNLDPHTTLQELRAVFEPYGPIDTCRLLQEKECAFVNFVHLQDAIRAKEDVLDRLGGQLNASSSLVRIGYGKEVSASSTPQLNRPSGLSPSLSSMSLLEPNTQAAPTRALWIGAIPPSTTSSQVLAIFSQFGPIESARVLTHKSCGFVNFERVEDAISARQALNGCEILGGEAGPVRIGFAKVPSKMPFDPSLSPSLLDSPSLLSSYGASTSYDQAGGLESYHSNLAVGLAVGKVQSSAGGAVGQGGMGAGTRVSPPIDVEAVQTVLASSSETQLLMRGLSGDDPDLEAHVAAVEESSHRAMYYTTVPQHLASDPVLGKRYGNADAMRLRDYRKRLDEPISAEEVDQMAMELIEEVVPLSSDYIGNTIIQKIFERATLSGRMAVLERLAPHLATIGTHKNGTWSVQKLIQCAQTQEEFVLIGQNLRPFAPPLLLNDFGNYVVQGALRFGAPACDFIFDAMVDRIWEIGSGRFGARSTRQILETPGVSTLQVKRVAIAILLNAVPLATSANGTLLLNWLLDSSNLPNRYRLLAPRFAPALAHLCTHKLAAVTVHKLVSQAVDPQASRIILEALFDSKTTTLEDILSDQAHGIGSVSKLIHSRTDSRDRAKMIDRVKLALTNLHVQTVPTYQRFLDDLAHQIPSQQSAPPLLHFQNARSPPRHHSNLPPSNGWGQQSPQPQQQQFVPTFHQGPYGGYQGYAPPPPGYGQFQPYPSSPYANGPPLPMLHPSQIHHSPNFIGGFAPPPLLPPNGMSPNLHPAMLPPMASSPGFTYPTSPEMSSQFYPPGPPNGPPGPNFGRGDAPYNTLMNNAGFPPLQ